MNDQDKPNDGILVPVEPGELAPAAHVNPLVLRGMADLAKVLELPDGKSRHPFKVLSGKTFKLAVRAERLQQRLRDLESIDSPAVPKATVEPGRAPGGTTQQARDEGTGVPPSLQ